jgi:hypothetical protein
VSLKDDIEVIKNDIVGESRFLEEYIKIEKFIKKYKKLIISIIGILIVIGIANYSYSTTK